MSKSPSGRLVLPCLVLLWPALLYAEGAFSPTCTIPYSDIVTEGLDIDAECGPEGTTNSAESKAQNRAKNNLCAKGDPAALSYGAFNALQRKVDKLDIRYGSGNSLPRDREELRNVLNFYGKSIGEGTVVRYVAFISHPRYSNTSKGESVNCKRGGRGSNDIHVDLVRSKGEDACRSVTMEVIPHFRPEYWEVDILKEITNPVRVTGHLFFDGSHKPCTADKVHNPKRVTVWEIHPVYAIDVCKWKSINSCSANNEAAWEPLHKRVNIAVDEDEEDGR